MTKLPQNLTDLLPDNLLLQQRVIASLQSQLHRFGYAHIDTPLVEMADQFLTKAGDAAIARLVSFDLPGKRLCLRPEFTTPAARVYIENYLDSPDTVRLQFAGPILQFDDLSHTRFWQQNAVGAELLNEHNPAVDAEVVALPARMLTAAGLTDWTLTIGHSGLIEQFLSRYDLERAMRRFVLSWLPRIKEKDALEAAQAELDVRLARNRTASINATGELLGDAESALQVMIGATPQRGPSAGRTREEIARRLLGKQQQGDQHANAVTALRELRDLVTSVASPADLPGAMVDDAMGILAHELASTFELLEAYEIPASQITFDLSFNRNLDYYNGIVFEYRSTPQTGNLLLGGGGRYDELVQLLGAPRPVPAVGFMLYVSNILKAQARHSDGEATAAPTHIVMRTQQSAAQPGLIRLACELRNAGLTVTTDLSETASAVQRFTHVATVESSSRVTIQSVKTGKTVSAVMDDTGSFLTALEELS